MMIHKILTVLFLLLFIGISNPVASQSWSDLDLIKQQDFKNETYFKHRKVSFLFTKSKNRFVRYNPLSLTFGGMMYVYQKFISVQIGANCPYEISCSSFSKQCIQHYGLIKGIALSADRLMRCTRLASADLKLSDINEDTHSIIDPVDWYQRQNNSDKAK